MNFGLKELTRFIRNHQINNIPPLTQKQFAIIFSISPSSVSLYERGLAKIPQKIITKIEDFYQLPPESLSPFYGTESFTKSEKKDALYAIFSQASKSKFSISVNQKHNYASDIYLVLSLVRILSNYSINDLCDAFNLRFEEKKWTPALVKELETCGNIPNGEQLLRYSEFFNIQTARFSFWIDKPNACIYEKKNNLHAIYTTIKRTGGHYG